MNWFTIRTGLSVKRYSHPKRGQEQKSVTGMVEQVLHPYNLQGALWQVISNKGNAGVDGRKTTELTDYFREIKSSMLQSIKEGKYHAQPILGVDPREASS